MAQRNSLLQKLLNDPERRVTNQRFVVRQPRIEPNLVHPNPNPEPSQSIFDRPATPPPTNRPLNPKIQFARLMKSGKSISLVSKPFSKMTVISQNDRYFPK